MNIKQKLINVLVFGIFLITLSVLAMGIIQEYTQYNIVPNCTEDSVLVGVGNFDNGRWSSYKCGPAVDDFLLVNDLRVNQ